MHNTHEYSIFYPPHSVLKLAKDVNVVDSLQPGIFIVFFL